MASKTLSVVVTGDAKSVKRMFNEVERGSKRVGDQVDKTGKRFNGFASVSSTGFKRVGVAAAGMGTAGAAGVALLAKSFVSGASDINESLTKNVVLFGKYADGVDKFSQSSAKSFGISRSAALEYTGVFGNLFRATGVARDESAKFSVGLTKLAADMASFNNTSIEDALEAIRSGIVGESEPLRRFGVNLTDAQLRTQALHMGLVKTTKEALDPQSKALAAQALIVKQTSAAHGDFARTSGGLANQQRILKARVADAGANIGKVLMPAALSAVKAINSLFDSSTAGGRAIRTVGRVASDAADALKGAWASATRAVSRWVGKNSDEIHTAGQAFRNLGKAAKFVFEEILLPVIRATIRAVLPIIRNLIDTLGDLLRFVSNVFTGRWGKAWDALKDLVKDAFRHVRLTITGFVSVAWTAAKSIGGAILKGVVAGLKGIGNAILGKIKGGISFAADKAKDFINAVNPFGDIGDGIGKKIGDGVGVGASLGTPGLGGGTLMGADNDLAPFAAVGSRFGLRVSSGLRPGAVTSSGNPSYHGSGDAIDEAGSPGGMMGYFRYLKKNFGSRLRELIYTPGGVGIKDGRPYRYTGQVAADHFDHVHVAYTGPFGDGVGDMRNLWTKAGGSPKAANMAAAIAMAESGGRRYPPDNENTDGSVDRGPWQINSVHGSLSTHNPMGNARAAVSISGNGRNWNPWVTFKTGAYRQFLSSDGAAPGSRGGGGGGAAKAQGAARKAAGAARRAARTAHGKAVTAEKASTVATPQDIIDTEAANADIAEAQGNDAKAAFIRVVSLNKQLDAVNAKLRKKGLKPKQRAALLAKKAQILQGISSAQESYTSSLPSADTGDAGAGDAGTGEDPNQPLIDALNAATEAAKAQADALNGLKDEQKRDTDLRERIFSSQSGQIMAGIADMVSGSIGGTVGLGYATPSFPGGRSRY